MGDGVPSGERLSAIDGGEVLAGVEAVRTRLVELAENCTRSLWACQPGGAQSRANMTAARPLDERTLARGVSMRTVYLDSHRNDAATREHVSWLLDRGAEIRVATQLPLRILIVDQRAAVIPLDPAISTTGARVVTDPGTLAGLSALFVALWRASAPFELSRPTRAKPVTRREVEVLELWAQGHTDEAVATKLCVSLRTVRRIRDSISESLDAPSRFTLGLKAAELGLVHSSDLP